MNRYELDKLNKEIERLTMENEGLANRIDELDEKIEKLQNTINVLEIELDRQYNNSQTYNVAKAIHEMQRELRHLHPELIFYNEIYAPDKVGGV